MWKLFGYMQKQQVFTRQELLASKLGTAFDITNILTPRIKSKGDPRGNPAAAGHLYYLEPIAKKIKGENKRFRLRWRETVLPKIEHKSAVKAKKDEVIESVSKVDAGKVAVVED
jgi:hypothetical protein